MGAVTDDAALLRMSDSELEEESLPSDHTPRYLTNISKGVSNKFYINGDKHYPGRKVVYNPKHFKDFTHYLDFLTHKMAPRFGAVRTIRTPHHGTRVTSLRQLQADEADRGYVVMGNEKFKPLQYDQITSTERKKSPPFKYDADPVIHSRQFQSSGRINKAETHSILIKVWPNGDDLRGPRRVLLTPRIRPFNLANVLTHVNEMLKEDCVGTVEKLYFTSGIKVTDVDQITQNGEFVACRKQDRFKRAKYTEFGTKNISTSPRLERKFLVPLGGRSQNSTNHSSPEHSNASTQNSVNGHPPRRRAPRTREEDQVFPAKPVKHQRSSEKVRTVDLDKDEGGVFKAKQNNRTTRGAREIQESRHTKTDLPVDQRVAREVEEERYDNRKQSHQQDGPRHRGGAQAKPNSRRPPPTQQEREPEPKQHKPNPRDRDPTPKKQSKSRGPAPNSQNASRESQRRREDTPPQATKKEPVRDDFSPEPARNPGMTEDEKMDHAATKIQAQYRGHLTRKGLRDNQAAAEKQIEDEYRGQVDRISEQVDRFEEEARSRKNSIDSLAEQNMAAAKIQAQVRGHQTRKALKEEKDAINNAVDSALTNAVDDRRRTPSPDNRVQQAPSPVRQPVPREETDDEMAEVNHAATTIQAQFRGYQARKEYKAQKAAGYN